MRIVQGGHLKVDSAYAALVVAGIAMALGGAALFGMVVYTKPPLAQQRVAGTAPGKSQIPPKPPEPDHARPTRPLVIPEALPPRDVAATPPIDSLSPGESVVVLSKPVELIR